MAVNNDSQHNSREEYRKKRVKRIKNLIIGTVFFLLIVPTVCCITMMLKVNRLEKQVESLVKIHEEEYQRYQEEREASLKDNSTKAYAAEVEANEPADAEIPEDMETPEEPEADETKTLTPEELLEQSTENKKVYLTFDDGPGKYSNELLDVLKRFNVKATFFVVGRTDEESLAVYKRIVDEGHTLAMHSYTHQYEVIYKNLDNFKKDIESLSDLLYEATGVRPKYYRFPGGSSNSVSKVPIEKCISYLNQQGITYFDWNVVNGDATGENYSPKRMVDTAMEGVYGNNNSMILMHDTVSRDTTVKSLPSLIKRLKKEGYVLLPISDSTNAVQHVKADSIK